MQNFVPNATSSQQWKTGRLEQFLGTMDYKAQDTAGKVSQEAAREKAYGEYEKYKVIQDRSFISDFDRFNNGDKLLPFDINPDKE